MSARAPEAIGTNLQLFMDDIGSPPLIGRGVACTRL